MRFSQTTKSIRIVLGLTENKVAGNTEDATHVPASRRRSMDRRVKTNIGTYDIDIISGDPWSVTFYICGSVRSKALRTSKQ